MGKRSKEHRKKVQKRNQRIVDERNKFQKQFEQIKNEIMEGNLANNNEIK